MAGKLIVIEGLDGAGKTTQWEMLKPIFAETLFLTFPDYESESGKIIRRYLNGEFSEVFPTEATEAETPENSAYSAYSASSFYAIDRYISYRTSWGEAYLNGVNVISARYTSSNAIYQMTKLPESEWDGYLGWLFDYEHHKLGIPKPDLTVFLDVPVEISQGLLGKRYGGAGERDIHEGDVEYLKACGKAAHYAAKRGGWILVDCVKSGRLRSPDDINRELAEIILKYAAEID